MDELSITYRHYRRNKATGELARYFRHYSDWEPHEKGGLTVCELRDADGLVVAEGIADCSVKDAFCYALGREIAKGRALKQLS